MTSSATHAQFGFLLDVDNTLLDNDALKAYLTRTLDETLGAGGAARFWALYEVVREERDVVDLPLTAERYAQTTATPEQTREAVMAVYDGIPFASFLYPHTMDVLAHLNALGVPSILSDGDGVFQKQKIERSGLSDAVGGRVLIYAHKEKHLDEVAAAYPVGHWVIVDDKSRILRDVKASWGKTVTTVHVLQGHYAQEEAERAFHADITIAGIAELGQIDGDALLQAAGALPV